MKILSWLLFMVGCLLCVIAFFGHDGAWPVAAICFFVSTMVVISQRDKKK